MKRHKPREKVSQMKLMTNVRYFFGMKSQVLVYMGLTFLMPTLAVHLKNFGYSTVYIGFCFGIPTFCYALSSTFVFRLVQRWSKRTVIFIGFALMSLALFMIGPSSWAGFDREDVFILGGLSVLGLAGGMIIIPVMPEMIEAIEQDKEKFNYDEEELNENISGMFVAA
jgi:MFS family permease